METTGGGKPPFLTCSSPLQPKFHCKDSAGGGVCGGEVAAVLCDDPVGQRQADAVALRLRGEKRNKDLLQVRRRNSGAGVSNLNQRQFALMRRPHNHGSIRGFIRDRFRAVAHQVQQRKP